MTWNIFKRIAELETRIAALNLQVIQHGVAIDELEHNSNNVTVEQFPIITDFGRALVKAEGAPLPMTEAQRKRERIKAQQRAYYHRNKATIAQQRAEKRKDQERKMKARERARAYYHKKKAEAPTKPAEQPRFISAA